MKMTDLKALQANVNEYAALIRKLGGSWANGYDHPECNFDSIRSRLLRNRKDVRRFNSRVRRYCELNNRLNRYFRIRK